MDVTRRVGGVVLFQAMALLLVVANIGAGMTPGRSGEILFGMGGGVITRRFFAYLDPVRNSRENIWLIGILAFLGASGFELRNHGRNSELRRVPRLHGRKSCGHRQFWVRQAEDSNRVS